MVKMNNELAKYIDHTLLKQNSTAQQIEQLCKEAIQYGFFAVCVPPYFVKQAKHFLKDAYMASPGNASEVKVATVVGFPLGYSTTEGKEAETIKALEDGADEIDMVVNVAALKSGDTAYVYEDILRLAHICHSKKMLLKVIFETALLTDEEIVSLCKVCAEAGVDFVKTSTGFAGGGATVEHVKLMRANLPDFIQIKASGGIKDAAIAKELITVGATRLGTSSGLEIVNGGKTQHAGY